MPTVHGRGFTVLLPVVATVLVLLPRPAAAAIRPSSGAHADSTTCSALAVTLGRSEGAAGSTYQTLRIRNASRTTCTVRGYPRVTFANRHHVMIGWPAGRSAGTARSVTLAQGQVARLVLQLPEPGNFSRMDCLPHKARYLAVRSTTGQPRTYLPWGHPVCTTRFARSTVRPVS